MGRGLRCARDATQQGAADAGLRASARAGLQRGGDQRTPDTPHGYLGGLPIRKRSVRSATTPASLSPVQAHTDQGPRCARVPFAQQVWPEHRKRALNGDPPIPHRRRRADPPLRALRPAATSATIVRRRLPGERSCRRAPRPDAMGPVGLTLGITRLHASGCGVAETRCGDRFRADACPKGIPASDPARPAVGEWPGLWRGWCGRPALGSTRVRRVVATCPYGARHRDRSPGGARGTGPAHAPHNDGTHRKTVSLPGSQCGAGNGRTIDWTAHDDESSSRDRSLASGRADCRR